MPNYAYRGINTQGKGASGVIDAESDKVARVKLRKTGIFPTEVALEGAQKTGRLRLGAEVDLGKYFQRVSGRDLANMTRQMATLVAASIPIVDTLTALVDQTQNPKLKIALSSVKERVVQGGRLSDAMASHPQIFSAIYVSMVSAGEASGALEIVLQRLADLTEKQATLKAKVLGALMYPMIMGIVALILMTCLIIFVVPKVTKIYEDQKAALPLPTRAVIAISDLLVGYWFIFLILIPAVAYGIWRYLKTDKGRRRYDRLSLRMPVFGNLLRLVAISRFSRTLATMLASGVQLLKAMDIVKNIMQNTLLTDVIENTKNSVREGESIAEPLRRSGQFPPLVTHMIAIGEKTGQLEGMMVRVADSYDAQVDNMVGSLTTLLNPIMIIFMGGIVFFIVLSIMLPMINMSQFGG